MKLHPHMQGEVYDYTPNITASEVQLKRKHSWITLSAVIVGLLFLLSFVAPWPIVAVPIPEGVPAVYGCPLFSCEVIGSIPSRKIVGVVGWATTYGNEWYQIPEGYWIPSRYVDNRAAGLAKLTREIAWPPDSPGGERVVTEIPVQHVNATPTFTPSPSATPTKIPKPTPTNTPSATPDAPNCVGGCVEFPTWCAPPIKGNVSFDDGERIYHVPGQEYYDETKINPRYGERWFCTEAEARAAGWRKSKR